MTNREREKLERLLHRLGNTVAEFCRESPAVAQVRQEIQDLGFGLSLGIELSIGKLKAESAPAEKPNRSALATNGVAAPVTFTRQDARLMRLAGISLEDTKTG